MSWEIPVRQQRVGSKTSGILFAGPWVGEFGWELMRWHGWVKRKFRKTDLYCVAMSDPGHWPLYPDAHEFWALPDEFLSMIEDGLVHRESHQLITRSEEARKQKGEACRKLNDAVKEKLRELGEVRDRVNKKKARRADKVFEPLTVETTKWSESTPVPYFVIAPRIRPLNPAKNWPVKNWVNLAEEVSNKWGISCRVVGRDHEIEAVGGPLGMDFEIKPDEKLARSIDLLSHAAFSVVPESGAGFLSTLCECSTFIFSHSQWRRRYCEFENPLDTEIYFYGKKDRDYKVRELIEEIQKFISEKDLL